MVNHMQVLVKQRRENFFIAEKGKLGGAIVNKKSIEENRDFEV